MPLAALACSLAMTVNYALTNWLMLQRGVAYAVQRAVVAGCLAFVINGLLFLAYDRIRPRPRFWPFLSFVVVASFVGACWGDFLSSLIRWSIGWLPDINPSVTYTVIRGGISWGFEFALCSLIYFAIDYWLMLDEQRTKVREVTALADKAQLQMLRYQLNPHFLFNTLNSLRAMVLENPGQAREMITEISDFLRYSLDHDGTSAAIGSEIAAVENYLAIQRMRFEKKLAVTIRVDAEAKDWSVPCFLIHPLVENAVKYGMETSAMPLRLEVVVTGQDGQVTIRVSNSGRLVEGPENHGTGTGLQNVKRRLGLAFPERHEFALREDAGWVHAEIRLAQPAREETAHRA